MFRMKERFFAMQPFAFLCILTLLSGCVLSAGQDMNSFDRASAAQDDYLEGVNIVPINGALVVKQLKERIKKRSLKRDKKVPSFDYSSYEYRLGNQDIIEVTVWGYPELNQSSNSATPNGNKVDAKGNIFFPYVGDIHVAGKTISEVRADISSRLSSEAYKDPQVDVKIIAYRSQRVTVSGEVKTPSVVFVGDIPLTVADAISAAGGATPLADLEHVSVVRGNNIYTLDVFSLINRADKSEDMLLQGDDIVYVSDNQLNKIFVFGEVSTPGSYFIKKGRMSLAEALGDAGGLNKSSANSERVYVIRADRDAMQAEVSSSVDRFDVAANLKIFELDASSPESLMLADQFLLSPRDVVFVSTTEVVRWARVVDSLLGTLRAAYLGVGTYRLVDIIDRTAQ